MLESVLIRKGFEQTVKVRSVNEAVKLMRKNNVKKMLWDQMTKRKGKSYRLEIWIMIKEGLF